CLVRSSQCELLREVVLIGYAGTHEESVSHIERHVRRSRGEAWVFAVSHVIVAHVQPADGALQDEVVSNALMDRGTELVEPGPHLTDPNTNPIERSIGLKNCPNPEDVILLWTSR